MSRLDCGNIESLGHPLGGTASGRISLQTERHSCIGGIPPVDAFADRQLPLSPFSLREDCLTLLLGPSCHRSGCTAVQCLLEPLTAEGLSAASELDEANDLLRSPLLLAYTALKTVSAHNRLRVPGPCGSSAVNGRRGQRQ